MRNSRVPEVKFFLEAVKQGAGNRLDKHLPFDASFTLEVIKHRYEFGIHKSHFPR